MSYLAESRIASGNRGRLPLSVTRKRAIGHNSQADGPKESNIPRIKQAAWLRQRRQWDRATSSTKPVPRPVAASAGTAPGMSYLQWRLGSEIRRGVDSPQHFGRAGGTPGPDRCPPVTAVRHRARSAVEVRLPQSRNTAASAGSPPDMNTAATTYFFVGFAFAGSAAPLASIWFAHV